MCSILDQRTAIVGDRLFFSGGNYTFDDGLPSHSTSSLYWVSLNDTIDVSGPIDLNYLGSIDIPSDSLAAGSTGGGSAGTFFYDHTTLYPYGGLVGPEADGVSNALWAFNTTTDSWSLVHVEAEGGKISFGNDTEGVHASDPRTGTSFYTGGWTIAYNGTNNGTVKFQSFNSDSPQWAFETTSGTQGPNILKGEMVYVRKGEAGVLIVFGGFQTAYSKDNAAWSWDRRSFSDIFVYDIASNKWYQQTATGDLPSPRTEFCAGVSSAPDDSSFQITMHGGWDPLNLHAFNDVYVLSIPSFRWIKVSDSNNPDLLGPDQPGRNRLKCDVWNESQLIVSGGTITLGTLGLGEFVSLSSVCNATYPPIKVLDTSTYTWRTEFDPSVEYSVPNAVTAVIGGNSSGGALLTSPSSGWDSHDLVSVFKQTVPRDTYNAQESAGTGGTTNPVPNSTSQRNTSSGLGAGAIAGIVVGIVVVLAAILATAFFCWKRKRVHDVPAAEIDSAFSSQKQNKPELDGSASVTRYELGPEHLSQLHGDHVVVHEMYADVPYAKTANDNPIENRQVQQHHLGEPLLSHRAEKTSTFH
ncbi:hypothetical protein GQX73_g8626 [Xylaria multiplex]|uniref:Kelch repeat protein n=1 Tax=Xylaria multiplex TaxID=323545 RepID=A0A7C8MT34_9PEZI|nr:hypothetical protein GQX73_g8626 [Xylaria multiplex]